MELGLTLFLLLVAVYAGVAAWLGQRSVTMPLIFVAAGALLGPGGVNLLSIAPTTETVQLLAEVTLALLLFADASTLRLQKVQHDQSLPARLLLVAFPLVVLAGALVGRLLAPGQQWGLTLLVATILAPTDAALGLPIFTDRRVPARIRRALNVESGLNDGIASPFVILFLSLFLAEEGLMLPNWVLTTLLSIGIAAVSGGMLGLAGGRFFAYAAARGWTAGTSERIGILTLGLGCFFAATALGGNGFVAAFVGGIVFGSASRNSLMEETEFTEAVGTLLSLLVWTIFGATLLTVTVESLVASWSWTPLIYALLSLTLVRMVPVALSLIGTGLRADTVALMGWFGPRGLASVVFLLQVLLAFAETGESATPLVLAATLTVFFSVVAHGLSAQPLIAWYHRRMAAAQEDCQELKEVQETRPPRPLLMPD